MTPSPTKPTRLAAIRVPAGFLLGGLVIALGLALDLVAHLATHADHHASAAFGLPEHSAHAVVLVGMVVVLATVLREGSRRAAAVGRRSEGSSHDAVR